MDTSLPGRTVRGDFFIPLAHSRLLLFLPRAARPAAGKTKDATEKECAYSGFTCSKGSTFAIEKRNRLKAILDHKQEPLEP